MQTVLQAPSPRRRASDAAALQYSVTGYHGFEDEILRLHNENRPVAKTRRWLDWRYARLSGVPAPKVFWMRHSDGSAVGMASLVFRRYWVNGSPRDIAVLGDISLHEHLRGRGLGRQLMSFVGWHLNSSPNHAALVVPNTAAVRSLSATGWTTAGALVPHVFIVDPTELCTRLVRNQWLARAATAVFKGVVGFGLRLTQPMHASLEIVDDVDESFDRFWRDFPKGNLTLRDMSQETLRWRYMRHPDYRFSIAKLMSRNELMGYMVFYLDPDLRTCSIADVLVKRPGDLRRMLTMFARHCQHIKGLSSIRLVLSDQHPYRYIPWRSGYVRRPAQAIFQVHSAEKCFDQCAWNMTLGDKDV